MMFLAIKTKDGVIKGKISFYCRMLKVTRQGYDILVGEEFSCLEFHMDRDTISWILNNWIQEVDNGEIAEIHT